MSNDQIPIIRQQHTRLSELRKRLEELMFIEQKEIEDIMFIMKNYPKEAFVEIFKLIKNAKDKQDSYLKKQIERDPSFIEKLKNKLYKIIKNAVNKTTKKESEDAENILKKLEEI